MPDYGRTSPCLRRRRLRSLALPHQCPELFRNLGQVVGLSRSYRRDMHLLERVLPGLAEKDLQEIDGGLAIGCVQRDGEAVGFRAELYRDAAFRAVAEHVDRDAVVQAADLRQVGKIDL